jgi:hypothetical protein
VRLHRRPRGKQASFPARESSLRETLRLVSVTLFPKAKQHVSILDLPIWFAYGLKLEFSSGLKGLDASARYHRRARIVCIR